MSNKYSTYDIAKKFIQNMGPIINDHIDDIYLCRPIKIKNEHFIMTKSHDFLYRLITGSDKSPASIFQKKCRKILLKFIVKYLGNIFNERNVKLIIYALRKYYKDIFYNLYTNNNKLYIIQI